MRETIHLNNGWDFTPDFSESFLNGGGEAETVRLPHTCAVTPFHYFDESIYQMVCGYRKRLDLSGRDGRRAFVVFGAAAHFAKIYLDGVLIGEHKGGYTSFEIELITENPSPLLCVELDTRESLDIPPFGHVIDYMTYGGLYRAVRLEYRAESYISDLFPKPLIPDSVRVTPKMNRKLIAGMTFKGVIDCDADVVGGADGIRLYLTEKGSEAILADKLFALDEPLRLTVPSAHLWDTESPVLYDLHAQLIKDNKVTDTLTRRVGFRRAEFKTDGFYLNGRKLKLRGLNRHQSYPYVGYAMPRSMQRLDADILKSELGCNAVRTSHYPQSHHFIGRCDELGLLVFTEIPGWQNIGGASWKAQAVATTAEMVREYRNHPSIILWGVRINESKDDRDFYIRTNQAAHDLDPTRPTGGVRCHKKSELLEDIYTYNDFIHDGKQAGCEPKKAVTSDMTKPYLISEYGGHMYPTKGFDDEEHRLEHMLRHARVLDTVSSHDDIAGSFGWCFFDYNTHKEFGAGDRICYHGVCDMFRNKKLAADLYAIQQDDTPILTLSSSMDIGDHPASNRGRVYILTNADCVRFYKNDRFIREYTHADSEFKHMKTPPIEITDYIGSQIEENENFTEKQAAYVRDILNESTRFGMNNLSLDAKRKAAWLMTRYGMSFDDAYGLYGKYIGNWGDDSVVYRFEAVKNGKVVKTLNVSPFEERVLTAQADHTELIEDKTYDVAAVRIRMTDQNGITLPYYNGAVKMQLDGDAELIAEDPVILRGGTGGIYIRTKGKNGKAALTLSADGAESLTIGFTITIKEDSDGR
ncbi:MAG: glycoside hydrolase family 2 protein [Ruminococcus sp.]|nr:glycoside hydrolase family 2 protein [Ruminococcus sp.]